MKRALQAKQEELRVIEEERDKLQIELVEEKNQKADQIFEQLDVDKISDFEFGTPPFEEQEATEVMTQQEDRRAPAPVRKAVKMEVEVVLNRRTEAEDDEEEESFTKTLRRLEALNLFLGTIALFLVCLILR